jgi:hypothetical protein
MSNGTMDRLTQVGLHLDQVEFHLANICRGRLTCGQGVTSPEFNLLYNAVDELKSAASTLREDALEQRELLREKLSTLSAEIRSARSIAREANARLDDVPGCEP